ncbi:hypothetical protein OROHE_012606 [Orobanche hederae]
MHGNYDSRDLLIFLTSLTYRVATNILLSAKAAHPGWLLECSLSVDFHEPEVTLNYLFKCRWHMIKD